MKIKTKRYYVYYLARVAGFLLLMLPVKLASRLMDFLGSRSIPFFKKDWRKSLKNLRDTFPEKSEEEVERIARDVLANLGRNMVEFLSIRKMSRQNVHLWIKPHGLDRVDKALKEGRGIILLTAHFGNWEFVGAYMRIMGYKGTIVGRRIYFHKYNDWLVKHRLIHNAVTIYRDESPKKILKVLKDNGVLGMLADQDIDSIEGVFVDFFGKQAYTPVAPVRLAMASGAPIMPCFMVRNGSRYDFIIEDPIYVEKGPDREESVKYYTQKWTKVLESYVRKYPEQWVWMHDRWKTKPSEAKVLQAA